MMSSSSSASHSEPLFSYETVCAIKDDLQSKLGGRSPSFGIILGSGLGGLGEHIEDAVIVDYGDVKFFPKSTVVGHKGNFSSRLRSIFLMNLIS